MGFLGTKVNTLTHSWIKFVTAFVWETQTQFFAKGTQKSVLLAEFLKLPVTNLEDIGCPKIEQILGQEKQICKGHSLLLPSHQLLKHCTCRKSNFFFDWIQNEFFNDANNLISKKMGRLKNKLLVFFLWVKMTYTQHSNKRNIFSLNALRKKQNATPVTWPR